MAVGDAVYRFFLFFKKSHLTSAQKYCKRIPLTETVQRDHKRQRRAFSGAERYPSE